jgi:hypothetical protein
MQVPLGFALQQQQQHFQHQPNQPNQQVWSTFFQLACPVG